ncbi:MAG: AMP-binding protein, partial [bacterium]|nr:AMP-binding protein [bacterium]
DLLDHIFIFENFPITTKMDELIPPGENEEERDTGKEDQACEDMSVGYSAFGTSGGQTNYDFNVKVEPGKKLVLSLSYNANVYEKEAVQRILEHFDHVFDQVISDETINLNEITLLSAEEKKQVLYDFNATSAPYPKDKTLYQLFEEQSDRHPHRIAVDSGDQQLTYGELQRRSRRLGFHLKTKGVKPGAVAALMVERSVEMIVAILSVLQAGAAYLPMDETSPLLRNKFILSDSRAAVILTQGHLAGENSELFELFPAGTIFLPDKAPDGLADIASIPVDGSADSHPGDPAYVIYTSGTTGKAKGVVIEHRSVVNLVYDLREKVFNTEAPLSTALVSPYVFDASVKQIFPTLLGGHPLAIVPEEARLDGEKLVRLYKEKNIRVSDGTPMHLNILLDYPLELGRGFPLETFVIGGDALGLETVKQLFALIPGPRLKIVNVYGPTECCDV